MANKGFMSKPAGGQAVKPGPSGKMKKFAAVGTQKPGVSANSMSGGGKWAAGGPSGKMQKFKAVRPGRPGSSYSGSS